MEAVACTRCERSTGGEAGQAPSQPSRPAALPASPASCIALPLWSAAISSKRIFADKPATIHRKSDLHHRSAGSGAGGGRRRHRLARLPLHRVRRAGGAFIQVKTLINAAFANAAGTWFGQGAATNRWRERRPAFAADPALGRAALFCPCSTTCPLTPAAAGSEEGERWVKETAARRHRLATLLARIDIVYCGGVAAVWAGAEEECSLGGVWPLMHQLLEP